jgi:hypothetical protein
MNESLKSQVLAVADPRESARILAVVIHELTVAARSVYGEGETSPARANQKLRVTNELIHQLSGQLQALAEGMPEDRRYPADVFLSIVTEIAEQGCAQDLEWAFRFALERNAANPLRA